MTCDRSEGTSAGCRARVHPPHCSVRSSQSGFSFVEVLVALVLSSLVVTSLVGGLLLLVNVTGSTSERQKLQVAVGNYSESVKALEYVPCATAAEYEAAYSNAPSWTPPSDIAVGVVDVEYWTRVTGTDGPGAFQTSCADPAQDEGTQLVTLTVALDSGEDRQVQIVKAQR